MSPNTNSKVKYTRQVQLALRLLALLGALGILFCVIAIKGTSGSLGWIIRVAPAVALLHLVYAVYHLCRSPTGRTPASSASYMLFAAMIDAGILPFLAFTAVMAHNEYTSGTYGWDTLFGVPLTTWYIVYSTFLLCVIEGGLLFVSLILGMYLAIIFRKIAKLPPDMNPLEPNLTARPHKRNQSELTTSDKHMSQTSVVARNRMSNTADPLIAPGRRVPFMHTRTDSADSVPIYQNETNSARSSRADISTAENLYQQSNHSLRGSYVSVNKSLPSPPSRPQSAMAPSVSSRYAGAGLDHRPARSSHLTQNDNTWQTSNQNGRVSPLHTYHQRATTPRYPQAQPLNDENILPISPVSSRASTPDLDRGADYMEIKKWYESPHIKNKRSQDYIPVQQQQHYSPNRAQQARHDRRVSLYDFDRDLRSPSPNTKKTQDPRNPLGMNPPSPACPEDVQQHILAIEYGDVEEPKRYALYDAPVNLPLPLPSQQSQSQRPKQASRPSSFVGSGSKGKYYGDLRSPVGSINNGGFERDGIAMASDTASDHSKDNPERTETMDSTVSGNVEILADDDDDEDEEGDMYGDGGTRWGYTGGDYGGGYLLERQNEKEYPHETDRKGRVVSNTGHDLSGGYAGLGTEFGRGMGRRREVSGKVVEEGRGGGHAHASGAHANAGQEDALGMHMASARVNGNGNGNANVKAASNPAGMGAAGWARFKGL